MPVTTSMVNVPLSELIRLAAPKVILPAQLLLPLVLRNTPPEEIPVPEIVKYLYRPIAISPLNSSAALLLTVTALW